MRRFFLLVFKGEQHGQIDPQSRTEAIETWACRECESLLPGHEPQDVRLRAQAPMGRQPLMGSFSLFVGFFRRPFLEVVCDGDIDRHFHWAFVLGQNGKPYRDWLIAVGRRRIALRGSDLPIHNYCPVCGTLRYVSRGGFFLYAPPEDVDVFDALAGQLVVTEPVMLRVSEQKWYKLNITEIPVAPEPLDDFGPLPLRKEPPDTSTRPE